MMRKIEKLIYLWRIVNVNRDKDVKFLAEVHGVMLRLGYINSGGNECGVDYKELDQPIAWELGIQPDSDTANFISSIMTYLEARNKCN
jgi:hypothetical protein